MKHTHPSSFCENSCGRKPQEPAGGSRLPSVHFLAVHRLTREFGPEQPQSVSNSKQAVPYCATCSRMHRIASPRTIRWAIASFSIRSCRNEELLGGHGFHQIFFEVHGVRYNKSDGSFVRGRYLPIIFEDSADAITFGRGVFLVIPASSPT